MRRSRAACVNRSNRVICKRMIPEIRQYLHASPFGPFQIVTSSGHRYHVASADHAGINPKGSRVVVWFDDEGSVTVSGLHIAAVEKSGAGKNGAV